MQRNRHRDRDPRQLWGQLTSTAPTSTFAAVCTPFELPAGGRLVYNETYTSTLTKKITFQQPCDGATVGYVNPGTSGNATVIGLRDPFYASTSPQIFAIATATVIAYLLVIIIFITPRTFYSGGPGSSGNGYLGRGTSAAIIGVGRRPWLQKIATVTVAISLTIATADTFRVAHEQYDQGYTDAGLLVDKVVGSREIQIVRVISDTFLWLAQVQTLIRLFPRHKEKVTIKWLGFALVSLDTIFSIMDDFVNQSTRVRPRSFQDAIPALNYLFELAISLIYASCVIYYSLSKRRFAFWHARMRNICLVALLSYMAILTPVVFFVLDVSFPNVAGWGDYIRWVGAAAASVVVWEWVERIEALERDERKDGILGREIFDGDEMLGVAASEDGDWEGRRQYWNRNGFPTEPAENGMGRSRMAALRSRIPFGIRKTDMETIPTTNGRVSGVIIENRDTPDPIIPAQVATPVSRTDTTSAASTIYAIRYHTIEPPTPAPPEEPATFVPESEEIIILKDVDTSDTAVTAGEQKSEKKSEGDQQAYPENRAIQVLRSVHYPFKRRTASPPAEVAGAQLVSGSARRSPIDRTIHLKNRLGAFTSRLSGPGNKTDPEELPMAVTVIPAQRRNNRTWSPGDGLVLESTSHEMNSPAPPETTSIPVPVEDMPVMIIPAPRRGQRTWSPEDAYQGQYIQSPEPEPSDRGGTTSPPSQMTNPAVISTRGSLTISEGQTRISPTNARSTYTRASTVPVLLSQQRSTPLVVTSPSLEKVLEQEKSQGNEAEE